MVIVGYLTIIVNMIIIDIMVILWLSSINDHNHNHNIYDNPIDNNPMDDHNPIDDHLLNETGLIIHFHNPSSLSMIKMQYHDPVSESSIIMHNRSP